MSNKEIAIFASSLFAAFSAGAGGGYYFGRRRGVKIGFRFAVEGKTVSGEKPMPANAQAATT